MKNVKPQKLSAQEEKLVQAYVLTGNQSESYRRSYKADKMDGVAIGVAAARILKRPHVQLRYEELIAGMVERNKITLDDLIDDLARMVRFDPADLYDETGKLKEIHDMDKHARQMLSSLEVEEIYIGAKGEKINIGNVKKVKFYSKLDSIEKLMKFFGAYEAHNRQKEKSEVVIFQLPDNNRG